jgi:hypothetical protein
MPCVNLQILPLGPVIDVHVQISTPRKTAMEAAGIAVPSPVTCRLLIDTGASCTCLDTDVIKSLNLTPSGFTSVHTPSTTANTMHKCNQYDVCLIIPHNAMSRYFHAIPVLESQFSHQGIDGLLGRDVLNGCVFIYNGELGIYTLSI